MANTEKLSKPFVKAAIDNFAPLAFPSGIIVGV